MWRFPRHGRNALTQCFSYLLLAGLLLAGLILLNHAQSPASTGEANKQQGGPTSAADPSTTYHFEAIKKNTIIGTAVHVVFVDSGGGQTTVFQVPTGAGSYSRWDRVQIIAKRLQTLTVSDSDWFRHMSIKIQNSEVVIIDGKTGQCLMTAD